MVMRKSRLIRLNSRFAQGNSNSDFVYYFNDGNVDQVIEILLVSAQIPRLFPNIFPAINTLTYTDGLGVFHFTVPTKQYAAVELAAALDLCPDFTVGYDEDEHRFTFEGATGLYVPYTILTQSTIANYIGLSSDLPMLEGVVSYVESPPNLAMPQIYLQTSLCRLHCNDTESLTPYIPLYTPIDCSSVPYGFNVNYSLVEPEACSLSFNGDIVSLRRMDIQLTDVYGNVLVLPASAYVDLVFRIYIQ
jgi:hypothetical protein